MNRNDLRRRAVGAAAAGGALAANYGAFVAQEMLSRAVDEVSSRVYNKTVSFVKGLSDKKTSTLVKRKMPYKRKRSMKKPSMKSGSTRKFTQKKNGQVVSGKRTVRRNYRKRTSLKSELRNIKASLASDQANHCHKRYETGAISSAVAQCNHSNIDFGTLSYIESFLTGLRYYDPSVPGTLVTANAATGSYQREIHFKNFYGKLELYNNYQVPCRIKIYLCKAKGDTSITPLTYYTNGITDQVSTGGNATTPGIFVTDIVSLKEQWSITVLKDVILEPGAMVEAVHSTGPFDYDPALADSHSLTYQKKYKSFTFLVRIEGIIGHDSAVAGQQTNLAAAVDYIQTMKADITYDAGVNLNDIYITDNRDTSFTNGGLVSSKPVADNIGYSAA